MDGRCAPSAPAAELVTRVVDEKTAAVGLPARTLEARFSKPWIAHASIGGACALAQLVRRWARLTVWSHTQGLFNLRRDLALAFAIEPGQVSVRHVPGAGCYGHNGADDVAFDAAWLARQCPGRPVRLVWSRADELAWAPQGPAMVVDMAADLDAHGRLLVLAARRLEPRPQCAARARRHARAARQLADRGAVRATGDDRHAAGRWRRRRAQCGAGLRFPCLACAGAPPSGRAAAQFGAALAGRLRQCLRCRELRRRDRRRQWTGPVGRRRLAHLQHDPRGMQVLQRAAAMAGWRSTPRPEGCGQGMGYARYKNTGAGVVVAEVEAAALLRAHRLCIAVDVGLAVNPDGVRQQIEGGAVQAISWTLRKTPAIRPRRCCASRKCRRSTCLCSNPPSLRWALARPHWARPPPRSPMPCSTLWAFGARDLPLSAERIVSAMDRNL